jgi:nitroreductase|tara:strand:+ start:761 stop:1729 length:969 start_codon:yes stop_codon:yes gene_type:complete
MLNLVKKLLPNIAPILHIIIGRLYDIKKFSKHCSSVKPNINKVKLQAYITRQYHGIEKGLTLPDTRLGFGRPLIMAISKNLNLYISAYGIDDLVSHAVSALKNYKDFNESVLKDNDVVLEKINDLLSKVSKHDSPIFRAMNKEKVAETTNFDFSAFMKTRRSIRDFAQGEVDNELLKLCILDAMETPSACNRQGWRVRIYEGEERDNILKYQNGNRGFNSSINKVLFVTGCSEAYSYTERNGMLVDGSLFSMSLILALHSRGIGSCPLNTSYTYKDEIKLRKGINLPLSEEPIMMIAVGNLKDNYKVAASPKKSIKDVLIEN